VSVLGPILFNIFINDIVLLSAPPASLQITPSRVVQLILLREGIPSRGTLTGVGLCEPHGDRQGQVQGLAPGSEYSTVLILTGEEMY